MALDWIVGHKPAPGHEEAGWKALRAALDDPEDERKVKRWLATPTVPAWVTVGAPRVGSDPAAAAWLLGRIRGAEAPVDAASATPEEREILRQNANFHVVDLAPRCDGVPPYSHGGLEEGLDPTSFPGAVLHEAEDLLGDELVARAYDRMMPDELLAYGRALEEAATRYATEHGVLDRAKAFEPPDEEEGPAALAHVVAAAGRWCTFWGRHGHWKDVSL